MTGTFFFLPEYMPEKKSKIFLTTSLKLRPLQLSDSFFALSGAYTP